MSLASPPACHARVRNDLAEVVDPLDRGATSAEGEVGAAQERAVLRVAAEVVRTGQVVAEPPHAAATAQRALDTVLERAEERVEGGWGARVRGWDQGAASARRP